jgi:hypothetical protein
MTLAEQTLIRIVGDCNPCVVAVLDDGEVEIFGELEAADERLLESRKTNCGVEQLVSSQGS